ncbi:hypothetical protein ACIGW0_11680 [Streptomyces bikiniensis]|uniref:Uncharacterized protein n=1 Tax=Streptomyces bikiniensis TaxID=1896 RepID=A0ABW8CT61_STRBI
MPVDPFAVLHALMRAEASRARRADRAALEPEPGTPTPPPTARHARRYRDPGGALRPGSGPTPGTNVRYEHPGR